MQRPLFVAGNWKMHKGIDEAVECVKTLAAQAQDRQAKVLLAVPFTALHACAQAAQGTPLLIGAQNMHHEEQGAFTGETSAAMLTDAGAKFVLLGHSERRQHFAESSAWIADKLTQARKHQLTPILCVGETFEEREEGRMQDVLKAQVYESTTGLEKKDLKQLIIAYEPVWAIGTGKTATPEMAQEAHAYLRTLLTEKWGIEAAEQIPLLYGGSVKPANTRELIEQKDIDGVLVGGASLDPAVFTEIITETTPSKEIPCP